MITASPTTGLTNCTTVLANLSDLFTITAISGATDYRFHFTAAGGYDATAYRGNSSPNYRMTWIPVPNGAKYGTLYNVEVSAKVGGVFLNYGSTCTIQTPTPPSTQLLGACGTIGTPFSIFPS